MTDDHDADSRVMDDDLTRLHPLFARHVEMVWHQKESFCVDGPSDVPDQIMWNKEDGPLLVAFARGRDALLLAADMVTVPLDADWLDTHMEAYCLVGTLTDGLERDGQGVFHVTHPVTGEPYKAKDIQTLHSIGWPGTTETITSMASFKDGHMESCSRDFHYEGDKLVWDETRVLVEDLDKGQLAYGTMDNGLRGAFADPTGFGSAMQVMSELFADTVDTEVVLRCTMAKILIAAQTVNAVMVAVNDSESQELIDQKMSHEAVTEFLSSPLGNMARHVGESRGL